MLGKTHCSQVPCHRAIRSDGSLGGYSGPGHKTKKTFKMEGISF